MQVSLNIRHATILREDKNKIIEFSRKSLPICETPNIFIIQFSIKARCTFNQKRSVERRHGDEYLGECSQCYVFCKVKSLRKFCLRPFSIVQSIYLFGKESYSFLIGGNKMVFFKKKPFSTTTLKWIKKGKKAGKSKKYPKKYFLKKCRLRWREKRFRRHANFMNNKIKERGMEGKN